MRASRTMGTRFIVGAAGGGICALAVAVLIGWQIHSRLLIQVDPTFAPLQRLTAVCFLLNGIALLFLNAGRKRAVVFCAGITLLLATLVCLEYAFGANFGIDQLLGRDYIKVNTPNPGRTSPVTALCFIGASLALIAAAIRKWALSTSAFVGILASILTSVGIVSALGYLFADTQAYDWVDTRGMALHSSAGVAVLGMGLMAWAWQKSPEKPGTPEWLPLSLGLGLATAAFGVWQVLLVHEASQLPLISGIILAGGILSALLVAFAVLQAQQARKHSRKFQEGKEILERLFDASPDVLLLTDRDGRIIQANQRVETTFGYTRNELLGQLIEVLIPGNVRALHNIHRGEPETRPIGQDLDLQARRKNGSEFPVDISLSPVQSGKEMQALVVARDITQRRQAEIALRESENAFVTLANCVPQMVWMCTPDGMNVYFNQRWVEYTGMTLEESYGRGWNTPFHPDDKQAAWDAWNQATATGETYRVESRLRAADGNYRWFLMRGVPLSDDSGNIVKWFGTCTDIDDLKRTEQKLQESETRLKLQIDRMPIACMVLSKELRILSWNPAAEQTFGFSAEEVVGRRAFDCIVPPELHPRIDHVAAQLMEGSETAHSTNENLTKDGRRIICEWTNTPLRGPDGSVHSILSMTQDITERKKAEEVLRQSEERFRRLFEQGPVGVAMMGNDAHMLKVNSVFCQMLGYSEEELTGMTPFDITHPEDREVSKNLMKLLFEGGAPAGRIEKRYIKKNGEIVWASLRASVIRDQEGKTLYTVGLIADITELKRAEAELRLDSEIFATMEEGVCLVRVDDGIIVHTNPKFEKMFGYNANELNGKHISQINAPDHKSPEDAAEEIRQEVMRSHVWRGEVLHQRKDGTPFWGMVTVSTFQHPEFGMVGVSIHQDITEQRLADKKLAEQAALLELAHDAIIARDLDGRITFWNRGAEDTYGWRAQEAIGQISHALLQTKFPIPFTEIEAAVAEKGQWEGELEHTARDGKSLIVTSRWTLQSDEQGAPRALLEINRNITERKLAAEQLRNLTERLSLAMRSASIGVWDWNLHTSTTVWDDTMFAIFGIPKVVPMAYEKFSQCVHPDDLPKVQASLERAIQGKTQEFVEFRINRPDGSMRHIYSASGVVLDEHGNVVRVVGTAVDITERKQMEAQIEANKVQLVASARLSALGMMAGGVAHEINNPLGIIHALASDLRDMVKEEGSAPPEMVARNSARIRETADRIAQIVRSLRQISREGSRDILHPTHVYKVVEATLAICRERFRANAVELILPGSVPELSISCREVQIEQILLNLLQNAFDAVVEQPGERWVRLNVHSSEDSVVFSVTDSGPGIPEELRPRIMEPFFTTKPVGKGTGLGLSLSKSIAEEHGGKLEYSQDQGQTCFSLILPLAREAEAAWT